MVAPDASGTPIRALLTTVFGSIIQVFLICLAGYILARRGILDKKTQKQVNHINISLFTPCLVFSKVAFSLSPEKLKELWIIPIFFSAVSIVSVAVAYLLSRLFRLKHSQRNFAMAAAMFMNSNSLPIALLQSLVVAVPGLRWGDDDSKDAMLGRALTYLLLCSTLGMILRWSVGVRLLSQADPIEPARDEEHEEGSPLLGDDHTLTPVFDDDDSTHFTHRHRGSVPEIMVHADVGEDGDAHLQQHDLHVPRVFYSFPNTPVQSITPSAASSEEEDDDDDELPAFRQPTAPTSSRFASILRRTRHKLHKVNAFMTAPLWASVISLCVAVIPPLQHLLEVHLQPIKGAVTQAGNCSIPVTLVVLGAYFHRPDASDKNGLSNRWRRAKARESFTGSVREMLSFKSGRAAENGGQSSTVASEAKGEGKTVLVSIAARMLITPALFLPLMILGAKHDVPPVFEDPVFVLSMVLLLSSPPALTLSQITQAASGDAFERLISSTIFWSYCVITPPATVGYSVIAMIIAHI
ncbi:hypothetical protein BV25DRAFT_1852854 [Artomyces pyxidatus]|uniref:Uncharacterized protein n=1 Tax=Artomyces pyxidatus TaxID=48021 RepID=A0ACB8T7N3_9AGAM|nr:hypothetical protein BV25DRAFT_1852854 [Artomyces pyxidatus]